MQLELVQNVNIIFQRRRRVTSLFQLESSQISSPRTAWAGARRRAMAGPRWPWRILVACLLLVGAKGREVGPDGGGALNFLDLEMTVPSRGRLPNVVHRGERMSV